MHIVHMGGLDKTIWFACFNGVLKQCGLDLSIIYVCTKVLEFWVMETTNIYDFLQFLNLIKIKSNTDFGGALAFTHICHNTFLFLFLFSKRVGKGSQPKTKVRGKKHTMASINLFVSFNFQIRVLLVILMRFHLFLFEYLALIMTKCILLFKVMCSCLFKSIIVHGIRHWNYLRFSVYFFNNIHVDLSMDVFSYKAKTSLSINAIALEHQQYNIFSY